MMQLYGMDFFFFNRNVDWFIALQVQPISKSLWVWVGDKLNEAWVETWKKTVNLSGRRWLQPVGSNKIGRMGAVYTWGTGTMQS
jgi:hypothetical protein